ncbi:MAG: hypothetical protein M3077_14950 [Candidatus Dormibacteraeota bacterium]|nr:hypothetical protein [Candidatus Dormibacteraeota bacterium]
MEAFAGLRKPKHRSEPGSGYHSDDPCSGAPGRADGLGVSTAFREPGGLSASVNGPYIADTNNHRIAIADWVTRRVRILIGD